MKMTIEQVMALVAEYEMEAKKTQYVPHYYVRKGQIVQRSYPDTVYTERYKELFYDVLRREECKVFQCSECGEYVGYFDLESWCCDFESGEYVCSVCYEEGMGDDL